MRKTKSLKKAETKEVTTDILCNLCGGSCKLESLKKMEPVFGGLLESVVCGSYFSSKLDDLTSYRFSLCEGCLRKLFDKFKLPVEINPDHFAAFFPETELKEREAKLQKAFDKAHLKDHKKKKAL